MLEKLKQEFLKPSDEFTPMPFWFWNDNLKEDEIIRQINDFKNKGVMGFTIHPRIGIPEEIQYLSDRFMELVKIAVDEAAKLGMRVILYDEAMYPSGSAHGLVADGNPGYAARGLRMLEYACNGSCEIIPGISKEETIISVQAVKKLSEGVIEPGCVKKLECINSKVYFEAPGAGSWSVLFFVQTYSKGTIRGIHLGEDDDEPGAPPASDLMNPEAMDKFIALTHDRYYTVLKEYFGKTIIAIFTDEPNILGRCAIRGLKPWTTGFLDWYVNHGGNELELPFLWFDAGQYGEDIEKKYKKAINKRLEYSYYKKISKWCEDHNIALTGHPHKSDEIGFLKYFQIPGQDIVWRYVAPEDGKGLEGSDSTMGKCSSDAARHMSRRRNSNECFGCCGPDGIHWAFSADDMKWYLDWLFVRGVNLIYPHAFYYSINGEKRIGERPPDVGPHNIWWKYYNSISEYIKRMSWLMTDSFNVADVAVLCEEDRLPWKITKLLYQNQIEFNYLEDNMFLSDICRIIEKHIVIEKQKYSCLVVEDASLLIPEVCEKITEFITSGGSLIVFNPDNIKLSLYGGNEIKKIEDIVKTIEKLVVRDVVLSPSNKDLRVSHVVKGCIHFYLLVNEGEGEIKGELGMKVSGNIEIWDAFSGELVEGKVRHLKEKYPTISVCIPRRESRIICIDTSREAELSADEAGHSDRSLSIILKRGWDIQDGSKEQFHITKLSSWTEWPGMEDFSGTLTYSTVFVLEKSSDITRVKLDLGNAFEIAHLYINEADVGFKLWAPYTFDITAFVKEGDNSVRVDVTNSVANKICKAQRLSGLLGPVKITVT